MYTTVFCTSFVGGLISSFRDLEGPALDLEETRVGAPAAVRQGILGRLNLDTWRSSTKIEALVEELSTLRLKDATTKSIVFSQFVNFLDLIAYRLSKAGFKVCFGKKPSH